MILEHDPSAGVILVRAGDRSTVVAPTNRPGQLLQLVQCGGRSR
jgi:hypothetical protein